MKGIKFISALLFSIFIYEAGFAQSYISTTKSELDPTTLCRIRYYYYPALEAYRDNETGIYFIQDAGRWITSVEIPAERRGGYSVYSKEMVAINDYDGNDPTQFLDIHKKKYPPKMIRNLRPTASLK